MNIKVTDFINSTIQKEGNGQYTNDPKDSGGPTRWGVTETTARKFGYTGDMRELPRETAVMIYTSLYWVKPGFEAVSIFSEILAERLFDFGVLAGQSTAAKQLQRVINVLNRNGRDYPDLTADGKIGQVTINALKAFIQKRGDAGLKVLIGMVVSCQSVYLIELAEHRPKDEEYIYGWELNRAIGAIL